MGNNKDNKKESEDENDDSHFDDIADEEVGDVIDLGEDPDKITKK